MLVKYGSVVVFPSSLFVVPVFDKFLLYAPLQRLSALVNQEAVRCLRQGLQKRDAPVAECIRPLLNQLQSPPQPPPSMRTGPLTAPVFLGIIPTRGCNMGCRYCDFMAPKHSSPTMPLPVARAAVDAYLNLLIDHNSHHAAIHFFGGEPFYAADVVHFVVNYAAVQTARLGMSVHFETITNGLYSAVRCQWIADHFNTVILSLDGPEDIQNRHRPGIHGQNLYDVVARSGHILSVGTADLNLRACVTSETVHRLPEIAHWICQEFHPHTVCFESLTPSPLTESAGLYPPDPIQFAQQFNAAAQVLASYGINAILSTADISANQTTFCPVGQDALIVAPDGFVNACYLLEQDWQERGLEMRLGQVDVAAKQFQLEANAVQQVRQLAARPKPQCERCLCRYHCAGGCHVKRSTAVSADHYDDVCVQTRLVTTATLLNQLEQPELATAWLANKTAVTAAAYQPTDLLADWEAV